MLPATNAGGVAQVVVHISQTGSIATSRVAFPPGRISSGSSSNSLAPDCLTIAAALALIVAAACAVPSKYKTSAARAHSGRNTGPGVVSSKACCYHIPHEIVSQSFLSVFLISEFAVVA